MAHRSGRLVAAYICTALLIAVFISGTGFSNDDEDSPEQSYLSEYTGGEAERTGSDACLLCHPDSAPETLFNHVALIDNDEDNPAYGYGCEGCHGPGGSHYGDILGILHPPKMDQDEISNLCSECHEDLRTYDKQEWFLSEHYYSDLSCLDCHDVHSVNEDFLVKEDATELCYTCHMGKRAEFKMRSHHPVDEGQMDCSDCHNPMSGRFDAQLVDDGDEVCFECHGDKEGPFAFDHDLDMAAGADGCLTCHFVHGSNTDNLLTYPQRLCLQCHNDMGRDGHFLGTCWTSGCHSDIHGSYTSPFFIN